MPRSLPALLLAMAAAALAACPERTGKPVAITVGRNGYEPARISARAGEPLVLVVTRTVEDTCATELVIPEANVNAPLPLGQPVRVTLTPAHSGLLRFSCAMGMFQGVIDVK